MIQWPKIEVTESWRGWNEHRLKAFIFSRPFRLSKQQLNYNVTWYWENNTKKTTTKIPNTKFSTPNNLFVQIYPEANAHSKCCSPNTPEKEWGEMENSASFQNREHTCLSLAKSPLNDLILLREFSQIGPS